MKRNFRILGRFLLLSISLSVTSFASNNNLDGSSVDSMQTRLTAWIESQDATLRYAYRAESFNYSAECGETGGVEIIFSSNYGLQKFLTAISEWAYFLRKLDFEDVFCVKRSSDIDFMIVNVDGWILGDINYEDPL